MVSDADFFRSAEKTEKTDMKERILDELGKVLKISNYRKVAGRAFMMRSATLTGRSYA